MFLVPRRGGQHDVGVGAGTGHPEVDGGDQVQLGPRRGLVPAHLGRAQRLGGLPGAHRVVHAQQVPHEVLHALAGGPQQVGPPDGHHPGEVRRVVRILAGEAQTAGLQLPDHVVADALTSLGRLVGQVQRVAVEGGVRGRPAHPRGLGERVGERLPAEQAPAQRAGQFGGAEALVPPLVGVQVEERRAGHVPGRPLPVQRERDLLEPGQRPHLLLAYVVRPAAAVHALAPAQHGEREERAVDLVGVEPVVGAGAHRDHRPPAGQFGAAGELPRHPRRGRGRHRGDRLLPGRRGGRCRVVVAGRPLPRQPGAAHRVLRQQQVEHGGHQPAAEPDHRHPAADHGAAFGLARVEARAG